MPEKRVQEEQVVSPFLDTRWRWSAKHGAWMCDNEDDIVCPTCGSEHLARRVIGSVEDATTVVVLDTDANFIEKYRSDGSTDIGGRISVPKFSYVDQSGSRSRYDTFCGELQLRKKQFSCRCVIFSHTSDEYLKHPKLSQFGPYLRYSQLRDFGNALDATTSELPFANDDDQLADFCGRVRLKVSVCPQKPWLQTFPEVDINEDNGMTTMLFDFLKHQFLQHGSDNRITTALAAAIGAPDKQSPGIRHPKLEGIRLAVLEEIRNEKMKKSP